MSADQGGEQEAEEQPRDALVDEVVRLRADLDAVRARLEELAETAAHPDLTTPLQPIADRLDVLDSSIVSRINQVISNHAEWQRQDLSDFIRNAENLLATSVAAHATAIAPADPPATSAPGAAGPPVDLAPFAERLALLTDAVNRLDPAAGTDALAARINSLEGGLRNHADAVASGARDALAELVRVQDARDAERVAQLATRSEASASEIAALRRGVEAAVSHLTNAAAAPPAPPARPEVLAVAPSPVPADLVDQVASRVQQLLEQLYTALSGPLGELNDNRVDFAAALAPLHASLADAQSSLAAINEGLGVVVNATNQIGSLIAVGGENAPTDGVAFAAALAPVLDRLAITSDSVGSLGHQLGELASAVGSLRGLPAALGERIDAVQRDLQALAVERPALPPPAPSPAPPPAPVPVTIDHTPFNETVDLAFTQLSAQLEQLRIEVHRAAVDAAATREGQGSTADRLLNRLDADANRVLDTLSAAEKSARDQWRRIDTAIGDIKRELELKPGDGSNNAPAALVASAAAAMARLEARLDSEFETMSRQVQALGELVSHVVDTVDQRAEQSPDAAAGVPPVGERLRSTATSMLDALRSTSRQRANRRTGGPPRGLNSG